MRMLDLFAGRLGWAKAFLAKGWKVTAVDLIEPPETPEGLTFIQGNVLDVSVDGGHRFWLKGKLLGIFDFACASSPCENFSIWSMRHFHPNPPFPEMGLKLFNHTRMLFHEADIPYVMENVRGAQQFVGNSAHRCGPFHLWGNAVPPLMPQGIRKNMVMGESKLVNELKRNGDREAIKVYRRKFDMMWSSSKSPERKAATAKAAEIPPELAHCVAEYAERLLADRMTVPVGKSQRSLIMDASENPA